MSEETPMTPPAVEQSAVTPQHAAESKAFETHVVANQIPVPENFKSVGDWFNALKSAQGEMTRAKQELAQLKKQPEQPAAVIAPSQEQPTDAPAPVIPEELRIPNKPAEPVVEKTEARQLTQEEWNKYSTEFAVGGSLSETTIAEIKQKTNLPDFVITDFLQGQKARLQQAYSEASKSVGGKDELARIFDWSSKNLSAAEQANINATLASPSWEVALLGLKAKYDLAKPKLTSNEPPKTGVAVATSQTVNTLKPYLTKSEFIKERNDPRFAKDEKYRQLVETRMSRTNFNTLK